MEEKEIREHPFNGKYDIYKGITTLVLGTFPPKIKKENREFQFYYHHISKNKFWEIVKEVINNKQPIFDYNNDKKDKIVNKIIGFLQSKRVGICDIIQKCYSKNSADKNLIVEEYNDKLFNILKENEKSLKKIILTSRHNYYKKSAEDWFNYWIQNNKENHKEEIKWLEQIHFIEKIKLEKYIEQLRINKNNVLARLRIGKIMIGENEVEIFVPYSPSLRCYNKYKNNGIIFDMYKISFLSERI